MLTAQQIRELRNFFGESPGRFGLRFDVTENAVRRWEIGDRHPKYATMVKLNELWREMQEAQPA